MNFNALFYEMMDIRIDYSKHTAYSKIKLYEKHIKPVFGGFDINELRYPMLQTFLNDLLRIGYKPQTVCHIKDVFTTCYSHAERYEYLEGKNVAKLLLVKKTDNRMALRLNSKEVIAFVSAVKNEPNIFWRGFFMFLLTGRRLGEVKRMQWGWLNLVDNTVCVPALSSKDRRMHTYALPNELVDILKILPRNSDFVFASPVSGQALIDVRKAFLKILSRANISKKNMRIHDIRHLYGTSSVNSGFSLDDVAYSMGHNSIQTTMRYVRQDTSKSAKVSSFIFSLSVGLPK